MQNFSRWSIIDAKVACKLKDDKDWDGFALIVIYFVAALISRTFWGFLFTFSYWAPESEDNRKKKVNKFSQLFNEWNQKKDSKSQEDFWREILAKIF